MQGNDAELPDDLQWVARAVQAGHDHVRITEIVTKKDMSKFARAHQDGPLDWKTCEGPGGTILVVEPEDD